MLLARLVVFRRPAHQPGRQRPRGPGARTFQAATCSIRFSSARPSPSAISSSASRASAGQRQARGPLLFRPLRQPLQIGQRQPVQHDDLRRDSSAAFSSNDGFSVVAPTSRIVPSSICGRKPVLLRLVEAVDLVHEQQRALPVLRRIFAPRTPSAGPARR
jgi:hypothetical protein